MSSSECSAADHSATREITEKLQQKMARIARKILVLSGKGGVGKSTVAANLAFALSETGKKVGLLDVDIHGPSIPRMVGLAGQQCFADDGEIIPLALSETLCVMSIAFLLSDNRQAVIWRGPMKYSVIQKLLAETNWGDLDYLIIDAPPGTGDEPLSVAQLVGPSSGAVIVTTPQTVAVEDVRRCITFCEQVGLPIHGLVENMAYLTCPHCQETIELFGRNGGATLSAESGVPLLGSIPIDPAIVVGGDSGVGIAHAATMRQTKDAFTKILQALRDVEEPVSTSTQETFPMKIAIPLAGGKLSMHFGHCEQFALLQIDPTTQTVTDTQLLVPPPHEPGVLPKWLAEQGATVILAGGMGQRAQQLFIQNGIEVRVGAPASTPEELAQAYLAGSLVTGENVCDH